MKINVLFICHGNICRSPMGEFILKDMVRKKGIADQFHIESAATSYEEIGNPVYPPARRELNSHGINCDGHAARHIERRDYDIFDIIIGMDSANMRNMQREFGGDPEGKLHKMLEYTGEGGDVADPWYTGEFATTYRQVKAGCEGLLEELGY